MANDRVFLGGVPTEPDVRLIRETFPDADLTPGVAIPYEDIEHLLGVRRDQPRFRTVTTKWRVVFEHATGRVISAENAKFAVLTSPEMLSFTEKKLCSAVRQSRRGYVVSGRIHRRKLSDEQKIRHDNMQKRHAAVITAAQIKSTALLPTLEEPSHERIPSHANGANTAAATQR